MAPTRTLWATWLGETNTVHLSTITRCAATGKGGCRGSLTLRATCSDSNTAPHVSPSRKERSKGSKKGVGSSCKDNRRQIYLQQREHDTLLSCKHKLIQDLYLDFPLLSPFSSVCALLLRLCYIAYQPATAALERRRRTSFSRQPS